ncbi:transcriptional initiation protein Tat [uncultured Rothia sp.]|uniref:transcriptional initiation protein Tat n=1 Tax=uncultured Rothia sp. TaxID=316088 RepID=UPI002621A4CF|nr:transcriptional initiation protein Tat [uncultured Rothia sp.]
MTSSQPLNTTDSMNRRTLVKGAAWSTPVIAAAAAVPAYASSIDSEIPTVKYGVFTQAFNSDPSNDFDTRFGLDSYTVQVANATATSTTPQSAGGGTFTPGGSVGAGLYGGAGLWFSAPINSKGEYQGKTYLQGGATLRVTLKFTFPSADEIIEPMLWDAGETIEIPTLKYSEGGAKTNNPALNAFNGADLTVSFNEPVIEGNTWTGTMTVTTSTNDSATAPADGAIRYGQILASQAPVYLTEVTSSYTLTTTITVISGTLALELTDGGAQTYQDISGLTASATISR